MLLFLSQYMGKRARVIRPPLFTTMLDFLGWAYQVPEVNGEQARQMNADMVFDNKPALEDFGYNPRGYMQGTIVV